MIDIHWRPTPASASWRARVFASLLRRAQRALVLRQIDIRRAEAVDRDRIFAVEAIEALLPDALVNDDRRCRFQQRQLWKSMSLATIQTRAFGPRFCCW